MIETLINLVLFIMLVATAIAILNMTRLFGVVMLSGVFSLLSALLFVTLDAVDVAFTEAAVGAGISTVLMLGNHGADLARRKDAAQFFANSAGRCDFNRCGSDLWNARYATVRCIGFARPNPCGCGIS